MNPFTLPYIDVKYRFFSYTWLHIQVQTKAYEDELIATADAIYTVIAAFMFVLILVLYYNLFGLIMKTETNQATIPLVFVR